MTKVSTFNASLLTAVMLACGSTAAVADENVGLFVGGGVGQFGLEFDDIDDAAGDFDFDESDTAFKLFAGWRFNPYISAELAYMNLGNPSDAFDDGVNTGEIDTDVSGFAPYLVGTLPLGMFELYARVGYLFYDVDVDVNFGSGSFGSSDSGEAFAYGVGAGIVVLDHLNFRLEYEKYEISDADNADAYWLTAAWRF